MFLIRKSYIWSVLKMSIVYMYMITTKQTYVSAAYTCITSGTNLRYPIITEVSCVYMDLTLKVLIATIDAQWEGMGDVGSARYEPALLLPCPTIRVLSYSN